MKNGQIGLIRVAYTDFERFLWMFGAYHDRIAPYGRYGPERGLPCAVRSRKMYTWSLP